MATMRLWIKLVLWKALSGLVLVLCGMLPSLILNWNSMTGQGQTVAVLGVAVGAIKFLDAFFDETASRYVRGKPLVPLPGIQNGNGNGHGDTTVLAKTTTTTTTTSGDSADKPPETHP